MQYLKKQDGYALLVTLLIMVVFSILGASLLMFTSNGGSKNEIREDITQSADLSQKGIDLITTQINSELTTYLGTNGRPRTEFIFQLENYLNNYLCSKNAAAKTSTTGKYKVCIDSYVDSIDENNEVNELKKLVTFKSVGTSGNSNRTLTSKIEVGAETAPEALRYAVGTNIDSADGLQPGEGNLLMHGGVDITGDIKVDGNIVTSSNGYALLGSDRWIPSLAPSAKPLPGTDSSRLFLGKKSYFFTHSPTYSTHITQTNFTNSNYSEKSDIENLFRPGYAPELVSREPTRSPIGITSQKSNFQYASNSQGVTRLVQGSDLTITDKLMSTSKVYLSHSYFKTVCVDSTWWGSCKKTESRKYEGDNETYAFEGTNTFKQVSTNGNIDFRRTDTTFKNGLYVEGDLSIGNGSNSENPNDYARVILDGPIYVNGNVTIKGADLLSNVLMYVNGTVTIEYSRINGKQLANGKNGSLIILSRGNVKISNNSVNQDTPSYIKGFFYTEQDFEMYGVGSNIKIDGGISARKIVLNAIRGRARDTNFTGAYKIPNRADYFEGVNEQANRDSRLSVIYDDEIISTYSDLKQQEPVIYKVDPPLEKDRSY